MGADTLHSQLEALREGDEAIASELADLDAKLREWLEAMRSGQARLVAVLTRSDSGESEHATDDPMAAGTEPTPDESTERRQRLFQTETPSVGVQEPVGAFAADEPTTEEPVSSADDEALLAELDEETAKLVRLKRRMSGKRRGVRELLEEIRTERKPAAPRENQRSHWWRR